MIIQVCLGMTGHFYIRNLLLLSFLQIHTFVTETCHHIWFVFSGPKENKAQLNKTVEDEYKTWSSMSNEHDIVQVLV